MLGVNCADMRYTCVRDGYGVKGTKTCVVPTFFFWGRSSSISIHLQPCITDKSYYTSSYYLRSLFANGLCEYDDICGRPVKSCGMDSHVSRPCPSNCRMMWHRTEGIKERLESIIRAKRATAHECREYEFKSFCFASDNVWMAQIRQESYGSTSMWCLLWFWPVLVITICCQTLLTRRFRMECKQCPIVDNWRVALALQLHGLHNPSISCYHIALAPHTFCRLRPLQAAQWSQPDPKPKHIAGQCKSQVNDQYAYCMLQRHACMMHNVCNHYLLHALPTIAHMSVWRQSVEIIMLNEQHTGHGRTPGKMNMHKWESLHHYIWTNIILSLLGQSQPAICTTRNGFVCSWPNTPAIVMRSSSGDLCTIWERLFAAY